MEPHCAGGRVVKAPATLTQTPTSTNAGERAEVRETCTGSQTKVAIPGTIVTQSECPRLLHADPPVPAHPGRSSLE
jgi:hypothetical protein